MAMLLNDVIKVALAAKKASKSNLVKVGCAIEDATGTVFSGFNGHKFIGGDLEDDDGKTKPGVIHAEADAITYACFMGTMPLYEAIMVVTTAPCMNCAALIINSGIKHVYYIDRWWDAASIDLMLANGVKVTHLKKRRTPDTSQVVPIS